MGLLQHEVKGVKDRVAASDIKMHKLEGIVKLAGKPGGFGG